MHALFSRSDWMTPSTHGFRSRSTLFAVSMAIATSAGSWPPWAMVSANFCWNAVTKSSSDTAHASSNASILRLRLPLMILSVGSGSGSGLGELGSGLGSELGFELGELGSGLGSELGSMCWTTRFCDACQFAVLLVRAMCVVENAPHPRDERTLKNCHAGHDYVFKKS